VKNSNLTSFSINYKEKGRRNDEGEGRIKTAWWKEVN
jgi:hypothetical protein